MASPLSIPLCCDSCPSPIPEKNWGSSHPKSPSGSRKSGSNPSESPVSSRLGLGFVDHRRILFPVGFRPPSCSPRVTISSRSRVPYCSTCFSASPFSFSPGYLAVLVFLFWRFFEGGLLLKCGPKSVLFILVQMDSYASALAFKGSVAEAIAEAKAKNEILLVYVSDPIKAVPSISAVGYNGVLLWQSEGDINPEKLLAGIQKAWSDLHSQEAAAAVLTAALESNKSEDPSSSTSNDSELLKASSEIAEVPSLFRCATK
ncbi:Plant UBX domain-containing protein 11 [Nymphaea thermarum]|nr:Plant UBX domain-containing protein 11 [Nymphaea thermarum]